MSHKPRLVVLGGPPASGKSTVARRILAISSSILCNVGDVLRSELPEPDLPRAFIGPAFLSRFGVKELGPAIARKVGSMSDKPDLIIIDAVRFAETCAYLRDNFAHVVVWFVTAPEVMRRRRLAERFSNLGVSEAQRRIEAYLAYDEDTALVRDLANAMLVNDGFLIKLRQDIDQLVGTLDLTQ